MELIVAKASLRSRSRRDDSEGEKYEKGRVIHATSNFMKATCGIFEKVCFSTCRSPNPATSTPLAAIPQSQITYRKCRTCGESNGEHTNVLLAFSSTRTLQRWSSRCTEDSRYICVRRIVTSYLGYQQYQTVHARPKMPP